MRIKLVNCAQVAISLPLFFFRFNILKFEYQTLFQSQIIELGQFYRPNGNRIKNAELTVAVIVSFKHAQGYARLLKVVAM